MNMFDLSTMTNGGVFCEMTATKFRVISRYFPMFVERARDLGGEFDRTTAQWIFDIRNADQVRKVLIEHYGTDGTEVPATDVLVDLDQYPWSGSIYAGFGRVVVQRRGRDNRVIIGDGVIVESGGFPSSGGSVKHPDVAPRSGTVLRIHDVPLVLAQRFDATYEGVKIVNPNDPAVGTADDIEAKARTIDVIRQLMKDHGIEIGEI